MERCYESRSCRHLRQVDHQYSPGTASVGYDRATASGCSSQAGVISPSSPCSPSWARSLVEVLGGGELSRLGAFGTQLVKIVLGLSILAATSIMVAQPVRADTPDASSLRATGDSCAMTRAGEYERVDPTVIWSRSGEAAGSTGLRQSLQSAHREGVPARLPGRRGHSGPVIRAGPGKQLGPDEDDHCVDHRNRSGPGSCRYRRTDRYLPASHTRRCGAPCGDAAQSAAVLAAYSA